MVATYVVIVFGIGLVAALLWANRNDWMNKS